MGNKNLWRNRLGFGLGTIGRDMAAALVTMYLMFYVTDVLEVSDSTLGMVTGVIVFMRIFDGVNDPFMGTLVDNTKSRWGKFKPWILGGALVWSVANVLMFADFGLRGVPYVVVLTLTYLFWEISYTANDISYWSMVPALARTQKEREKIGSVARISASIGMFTLVVALIPFSKFLEGKIGSLQKAWFVIAIITSVLMLAFQMITLATAKEQPIPDAVTPHTSFADLFRVIFHNDQLLVVTGAMLFFMSGYTATTAMGIYFFKYVYGDENKYAVFALLLGVSQVIGLAIFPLLSKKWNRQTIFGTAIGMVVIGYVMFFMSPMHMVPIGVAGVLIFVGQSFIQLLMMMYIADSVEYGQWKSGKRNESVTFSIQPLIYKCSNAVASLMTGVTLIWSGIKKAETAADVSHQGVVGFKISMMLIPLALVLVCFFLIKKFYKIDEAFYERILSENQAAEAKLRGEDV